MQSGDTPPSVPMVCFYRMRGIPILLWVVGLASLFLLVGCTDGGSQAHQHGHASHSDTIKLNMRSEHDSGVSGTASFEDTSDGVVVKLEVRNLPKPTRSTSLTSTLAL